MVVIIPTCPGLVPDERVLQSLYDQDITDKEIIEAQAGTPYDKLRVDRAGNKERMALIDNICLSRNKALSMMHAYFQDINVPCACMNDADEKHLFADNLVRAESFLINNPEYAAVGLRDGRITGDADHIMLGSWIFHRRFFGLNLEFAHEPGCCECLDMCAKIRKVGMRVCYLDGIKRLENLK